MHKRMLFGLLAGALSSMGCATTQNVTTEPEGPFVSEVRADKYGFGLTLPGGNWRASLDQSVSFSQGGNIVVPCLIQHRSSKAQIMIMIRKDSEEGDAESLAMQTNIRMKDAGIDVGPVKPMGPEGARGFTYLDAGDIFTVCMIPSGQPNGKMLVVIMAWDPKEEQQLRPEGDALLKSITTYRPAGK